MNDALYKRGFSTTYLKCVDEGEAKYILKEIHEGICGDNACPSFLEVKSSEQVTSGLLCRRMQESSSRDAISVRGLEMSNVSQQRS